jgi:hypothetical protein
MKDGQLMGQGPNGPALPLYAYSDSEFFIREMDLQLQFKIDESSKEKIVIVYDGGSELLGKMKTK